MPRLELPFDPAHPRCLHPEFGRNFTKILKESGKRPVEVAKDINVSAEIIRGYRRGFVHPSAQTMKRLEEYFGRPIGDAPRAPEKVITLPSTLTVQRHPSGDVILTFRLTPDQFSKLLVNQAEFDQQLETAANSRAVSSLVG